MNQMQAVKKRKNEVYKVKSANYTIKPLTDDMWAEFSTATSLTSEVTFTLPEALVGMGFRFRVGSAVNLIIDPTTSDTIGLPSTNVQGSAGVSIEANAVGENLEIECKIATEWEATNYVGTWIVTT